MYCCVCRCDVRDDHSEVATTTDDYLWLKLGLVTFDESEAGSRDGLTLTQLQMMLLEDFGLLLAVNYPIPDTLGDGVLFSIDFFVCMFVCIFLSFFLC